MQKMSELKEAVKAKGFGTKLYGNVNGEPLYLSRGVREVFFADDNDIQKVVETVGAFQEGKFGTAEEAGKSEKPGHEYGRYDLAGLEADTEDDANVWLHRAEDSIIAYFRFER